MHVEIILRPLRVFINYTLTNKLMAESYSLSLKQSSFCGFYLHFFFEINTKSITHDSFVDDKRHSVLCTPLQEIVIWRFHNHHSLSILRLRVRLSTITSFGFILSFLKVTINVSFNVVPIGFWNHSLTFLLHAFANMSMIITKLEQENGQGSKGQASLKDNFDHKLDDNDSIFK
jgi:hypothetical protein